MMIMDNKYDINDLVVSALEQKPLEFETAFNDLIVDRIRTAVENKKVEIAQQMYNYEPDDVAEPEEELDTEENSEEETNDEES
jgi:hypothetical protein